MAMKIASVAPTTDSAPFMPQAHVSICGARARRSWMPAGIGTPRTIPIGTSTVTAIAMRTGRAKGIAQFTSGVTPATHAHADDRDAGDRQRRRPLQAGPRQPAAQRGAQPGSQQKREQRDREREHRVAQQQHEPLEHGDLDQHEARAEGAEVPQPRQPAGRPVAGRDGERTQDEEHDERARDAHQREQRAQAVAEQHRTPEGDVELVGELRRMEEERPVVGRRPDVLRIRGIELLAIRREDQSRVVARRGAVNPLVRRAVGSCRRERTGRVWRRGRRIQHIEAELGGDVAETVHLGGRKRRLLQEKRGDTVMLDDREA